MKPVIIILAYNRPTSLRRLLGSIELAEYPDGVKLIISLEGGVSNSVREIANNFVSKKIAVSVVQHPTRLGLRKHVIACGDMALEQGSVIILEDDLIVDKYF
jgi:GT2 family glycosyltransferase